MKGCLWHSPPVTAVSVTIESLLLHPKFCHFKSTAIGQASITKCTYADFSSKLKHLLWWSGKVHHLSRLENVLWVGWVWFLNWVHYRKNSQNGYKPKLLSFGNQELIINMRPVSWKFNCLRTTNHKYPFPLW